MSSNTENSSQVLEQTTVAEATTDIAETTAELLQRPETSSPASNLQSPDLDMILNIPVELSLEVGRTEQTVEQVLALAKGSVIELNRKAGEPLDVKVNGTLIAHAEVVESQGKYGIRIIDVIAGNNQPGKLI
ncbi:flagellar motor switch protein FliN [Endozoicomonas sp. OPT23]|uniref:flagellar motor switch protein FliN n=1 Tax=Endozoicomonas sp. OPT23 TaxID=2072845 RepID=UPI00129BC218|nr:flagellar motor switch protein FliN [Endozoicomonas sp. OPT23]MRI33947.1 flagellar motor switch protein FliN [Endozoicomonas sp. OPT23]